MQPALAHWLQPNVVVELSKQSDSERRKRVGSKLSVTRNSADKPPSRWEDTSLSARVHFNTHPGRSPIVRIHLKPTELKPQSSPDVKNACTSSTSAEAARSHLGFLMSSSVCFSTEAKTAFAANYEKEQRPRGGTVLRTRVQVDAATALCDAVFDRAFDGMVYYRVPDFPTSLMLPGAMQPGAHSPVTGRSWEGGSGSSRDQSNPMQQSQKQAVARAVVAGAVQDATVHANGAVNSERIGSANECHEEPISKAQRKKALKKLARAQAKARTKAKSEAVQPASDASSQPQRPSNAPVEAATDVRTSSPKAAAQQMGIIIGPSGCAKSVLLRLYFGCPVDTSARGLHVWDGSRSIWSHFPVASHVETRAVEEAFESVGLLPLQSSQCRNERTDSSWLHSVRYSELSQGEQYLCDIAYLLIHCQLNRSTAAATAEADMTGVCGPGKQYSNSWRGSGVLLLDEFTSCLDRRCARRLGAGLSEYCRKHAEVLPRVVVAGCHSDVIAPDAFVPDWVFEADTMTLHHLDLRAVAAVSTAVGAASDANNPTAEEGTEHLGACPGQRQKLERARELLDVPVIKLRLRACSPAAWRDFREHHYKTQTLSLKARTFALTLESLHYSSDGSTDQCGDKPNLGMFEGICSAHCPVGFVATIPQSGSGVSDISPSITATSEGGGTGENRGSTGVHANATARRRTEAWRAHRTVVLPAWQGLGIGSRLSDAAAALHHREGCDYYGQTVHPRFGAYRDSSPLWRGTLWNHSTQRFKIESWTQRTANTRVRLRTPRYVYSHYFVGATQEPDDPARAALASRVVFEGNDELP